MKREERFDSGFAADVIEATSYYDAISTTLGNHFRDEIRRTLAAVRARLQSFGFTRAPSRGALLRKFPYVIIFRVTDKSLLFGGCFHGASNPTRWEERMADQPTE